MNFSIEQLQSFVAVYEQGSFSKAAQALDKHRTTIGQVITNLEDELAVELFERVGRTAQPTEDATLLYRYAKQVIEQAKSFDKLALSLSFGELESITIAYTSFLPPKAISAVRRKLLELHPNMIVNLIVRSREEIREGILDDKIQFGIVNTHDIKVISSIDGTLVNNITFGIFASKEHEIFNLPVEERWGALKSSKQIILNGMVDDKMEDNIVLSSNSETVDQMTLAIQLVKDNVGWGLLPRLIIYTDFDAEGLIEVETKAIHEHFRVPVSVWSPHSKHLRQIHSEIVSTLVRYVERVNKAAKDNFGMSN